MKELLLNPQEIAEAVRDAMWRADLTSQTLGMSVVEIGPGSATVTMPVRRDMLNGHAICHGGILVTLADSAVGFASNSYNVVAVATNLSSDFIAPARLDDRVTATARERARTHRSGLYDVTVTNQHGEVLALVRGRVHRSPDRTVTGD